MKITNNKFTKTSIISLLIVVGLAGFFLFENKVTAPSSKKSNEIINIKKPSGFKSFTGKQFEDLYNSFAYPNTQLINEDTPITENPAADARIRQLALARGYKLRSAPVTDTFVEVQKDMLLQQRAAKPWLNLKKQAEKDGIKLSLTAAYRSAKDEKTIFLDRLKNLPLASIASGQADAQVNTVLDHVALPGYSRHHTGYTVDIACDNNPSVKFEKSICFKWLSKDNYINAKTFGWMPSYPPGAGKQGPVPEPWEYVWVGTDALK